MADAKTRWITPTLLTVIIGMGGAMYKDIKSDIADLKADGKVSAPLIATHTTEINSIKISIADIRSDLSDIQMRYYQQYGLKGEGPDIPGNKRKN